MESDQHTGYSIFSQELACSGSQTSLSISFFWSVACLEQVPADY